MPPPSGRSLPKPLAVTALLFPLLALASVLDALIGYQRRGLAALQYLWVAGPGFDFYDYTPRFPFLHTPAFFSYTHAFPWVYPAPAIFILYPFYLFARPTHWVPAFFAFAGLAALADLAVAWRFRQALVARGLAPRAAILLIGSLLLFGWPFYFALQRGNIESLLWIGLAAGIYCFARGRHAAAALLLGIFGAAKLYPLLFLALFLRRDRLRYLVLGLLAAAATTLAGLRCLEPNIRVAYLQIRDGVQRWTAITTLSYGPAGVGPDHSLLGLLRELTGGAITRPLHALDLYLLTVGFLTTAAFLLRVRRLPAVNQVLFIACAAILMPPTSYDYTLLLILIPWGWLALLTVQHAGNDQAIDPLTPILLLFAVALAPLTFLHTWAPVPFYFEGPVRCVALVSLLLLAAFRPLQEEERTTA